MSSLNVRATVQTIRLALEAFPPLERVRILGTMIRDEAAAIAPPAIAPTTDPRELTDRQREVLVKIEELIAARGAPPTVRELGRACNIGSTNGVADHLSALQRKGYITRDRVNSARSIRVLRSATSS